MTRTRLGLLGLCAMVFGLMAFSATAQASGKWLFAEKAPNSGLVAFLPASIDLEAETVLVLHTEIAKVKVLFLCTTVKALKAVLNATGGINEGAILDFSGCSTHLNGAISAACQPSDSVGGPGTIRTNPGHALLVLHALAAGGTDDLVSILPDGGGKTFGVIKMGEECSIGEEVPVIGKATLKDCQNLALTHLVKHLVEIGPLTELWAITETAEHVATILGSAWAFLIGAHEGLKFSGDPI